MPHTDQNADAPPLDVLWFQAGECPSQRVSSAYDATEALVTAALAMSRYDLDVENGGDDSDWHIKFRALNDAAGAYVAWRPDAALDAAIRAAGEAGHV